MRIPAFVTLILQKAAIFTVLGSLLTACSTASRLFGDDDPLYIPNQQPQYAQQVNAEPAPLGQAPVSGTSSREAKTKLAALEDLYREMAREQKRMSASLDSLTAQIGGDTRSAENQAAVAQLRASLDQARNTLASVETRLAALEEHKRQTEDFAIRKADGEARAARLAEQNRLKVKFAIHLSSYRAKSQAWAGWNALKNGLAPLLNDKQPRLFTQEQPGVGTFLRLVIGPYNSEGEAQRACDQIRVRASDQYCQPVQFGGDALNGPS